MKLFLTATSERGKPVTKSGNEYLDIEILNENRESILKIKLQPYNDRGLVHAMIKESNEGNALWAGYLKGKPKTARECYCGNSGLSVPHYEDDCVKGIY